MFNRLLRTGGIGNSFVDSLSWGGVVNAPTYPPAGTVLAYACGTNQAMGWTEQRYDVLGTNFTISPITYGDVADGYGNSSWQVLYGGDENSAQCSYPYGFVTGGYVNDTLTWSAPNGDTGYFNWGQNWNVWFSDGQGGSLNDFGTYENVPNGYVISNNDASGRVVYISVGNWAFWYSSGTYIGDGWWSQTADEGCGPFETGQVGYSQYHDGAGGTYEVANNQYNFPNYDTVLTICQNYEWRADGSGGYFQGNYVYPYGTELASWDIPKYNDFGYGPWQYGTEHWHTYADGSGGTFDGYSDEFYPYGTLIGQSEFDNFYSDGTGYVYTTTGGWHENNPEYPPYGTELIPEQWGQYTISTDCGNMIIGDWYDDADYADGSGGYYNNNSSYYNYNSYGTLVGNCNGNNYFSDGSGGYYTESDGSGSGGGDNCEDPSMYAGQEGWSYDGCHWSYTGPNPPDYPSYGTLLSSDSGPISSIIDWSGYDNDSPVSGQHQAELGSYWSNTYADGTGGSYGEGESYYFYQEPTDIFEAAYGIEIKVDWATETPIGTFSGATKWADDVNVWKAQGGSTYMDRLYRRPSIFDGTVIFETPSWEVEGSQWKTQIILQGGGFITNTFSF